MRLATLAIIHEDCSIKSKTYKTKCFMRLNEKDYENIIKMIVSIGETVEEYVVYRKDGETLYFQYLHGW